MSTINAWNPFCGQGPPDFDHAAFDKDLEIHNNPFYRQDFGGVKITEDVINKHRKLRVVATGAGAAGLQVAYKFRKLLQDIDLVIYEKNDDVGGTWLENKYPGCACDIPSHTYQFYWNRNPDWSSFYSPAPEILKYLQDTAEKFDLNNSISFRHRVLDTKWDEDKGKWICQIQRPDGTTFIDEADILLATGGGLKYTIRYPSK
jgi:cation diffusion facilitator CzcD-associated flavoprotein CzcO